MFISIIAALATACSGNIKNVNIAEYSSDIYSDADIDSAVNTVLDYFKKFSHCTLTQISYAGDEAAEEEYNRLAERVNADEVMVLLSSFDTDHFVEGGFSPDYTYNNWNWILVRSDDGEWEVFDYGY